MKSICSNCIQRYCCQTSCSLLRQKCDEQLDKDLDALVEHDYPLTFIFEGGLDEIQAPLRVP